MTKVLLTIDTDWAMEFKGTFDEFFSVSNEHCDLMKLYSICLDYCLLMHNFILDQDNETFNRARANLNNQTVILTEHLDAIEFYQKRLYVAIRGGLNVMSKRILSISPVVNYEGLLYGVVIDYE